MLTLTWHCYICYICCNPPNERVDIQKWLANKTQHSGGKEWNVSWQRPTSQKKWQRATLNNCLSLYQNLGKSSKHIFFSFQDGSVLTGSSVHNTVLPILQSPISISIGNSVGGASMMVTQLETTSRPQVKVVFKLSLIFWKLIFLFITKTGTQHM